ncbi:exportin-6-A [Planococcus citri]|uniref:exportin-6-A n=1 Tax=Planococcus citri TaxID=170843 RepID=UPI0031F90EB2
MEELEMLEKLITEFYDCPISKERRDEIGMRLIQFEKRTDSWKDCLCYIERCSNAVVCSFFLRVMETTVTRNWSRLCDSDKLQIQNSLSDFLFKNYSVVPAALSKKIMKLTTIIARNEWPTASATFIPNIINMIISNDSSTVSLGLSYLLIACEELLFPREELSTDRKLMIRRSFETLIPQLFTLLNATFQKFRCSEVEEKIYVCLLQIYLQLFSWTPLSNVYTTEVLLPIFECSISANPNVNTLALSSLNEILYKNCVPVESVPIILHISVKLNEILTQITHSTNNTFSEEYTSKILEMVNLIFSSHWHRIESSMDPPQIMSLLSSFFKLTFGQRINLENYYTCLEIWCNFLEYLAMRNVDHVKQYEELLVSLLQEIIKKLQTKVDDEDEDEEDIFECTEVLQNLFLNNHANVIDSLAELIPQKTFAFVFDLWSSSSVMYSEMLSFETCATTNAAMNTEEIVVVLRTFERAIQVLTSLHSKLDDKTNALIVNSLTQVVNLANTKCAHTRPEYYIISPDLLRVHCELLMALPVWLCSALEKDEEAIVSVFNTTLPIVENAGAGPASNDVAATTKLQITAARLVSRIIVCIKNGNILRPLFADASFKGLPREAQRLLQCALCCWICHCKSESFDERLKFVRNLFEIVTSKNIENFNEITLILKECRVTQSEGRELLFMALEPWLECVVAEYPTRFARGNYQLCNMLMTFVLEAFRALLDQMKPNLIEKIIMMFQYCTVKIPLDIKFMERSGIDKMISILVLLIENPAYEDYTSSIISICCNVSLSTIEMSDVAVEANKLLYNILLNKWQYFYKRSHLNANNECELRHKEEFDKILEIVLKSLKKNSDITNYQSNLRFLEQINMKWNLFDKEAFRNNFLPQFLDTLIFTLIDGMLNLTDEILTAIYHMAAVNFEVFYGAYLPNFLLRIEHLTPQQKAVLQNNINRQTDMPSFVQTVAQLTNDIRSFQRENGHGWWISYAIGARD